MLHSYADMAAVESHKNSPKFAELIELGKKEDLFAKELKVMFLNEFGGFASRL